MITGTPPLTQSQQEMLGKLTPEGYLGRMYDGYTSLPHLFGMMGLTEHEQAVTKDRLFPKGGKYRKHRKSRKSRKKPLVSSHNFCWVPFFIHRNVACE